METLVGLTMIGTPFAAVGLLLALVNRRQRRRLAEVGRQIALTDAIHARLGAVVAPQVRLRRRGRWEVAIAAPLESPPMVAEVLAIVERVFAHPGGAPYEVILRRQWTPLPRARAGRPAVGRESLSWT